MNLIILTTESFPYGLAGTNRILSYSKGIVELGHTVSVICLRPTEKISRGIRNKEIRGYYNGIAYEYAPQTTVWPESGKKRMYKFWLIVKGLAYSYKILKKKQNKQKIDAVLLYSNNTISIIYFYIITRLLAVPYIQEKSEYPFILRKSKNVFLKKLAGFYINHIYKCFDAMIIETKTLMDFYKPKLREEAKVLIVPMTVEPERFIGIKKETGKPNLITYCGNLREADGISILIRSFKILLKNHNNVKLQLIGNINNNPDYIKYKEIIRSLDIPDGKVLFTGRIDREQVPKYLINSTILVLASPKSMRSTGSLPSKLGEYLATGNPVVITKVGEIPDYLVDGESAFLAEPGNAEMFAKKLELALDNPELAQKIGKKGQKVAFDHFNYKSQAKRIINFIENLN